MLRFPVHGFSPGSIPMGRLPCSWSHRQDILLCMSGDFILTALRCRFWTRQDTYIRTEVRSVQNQHLRLDTLHTSTRFLHVLLPLSILDANWKTLLLGSNERRWSENCNGGPGPESVLDLRHAAVFLADTLSDIKAAKFHYQFPFRHPSWINSSTPTFWLPIR